MLIYGEKVYIPEKGFLKGYITVENGKIVSFSETSSAIPNISAYYVLPGFIDIHTHGAMGGDTIDGDAEKLINIKKYMAENGTTSFLPTTVSAGFETILKAVETVKKVKKENNDYADIAGIYVEGPYFTEKYKGAHLSHFLKAPSFEELDKLIEKSNGLVKVICIAPEYENIEPFIKHAVSKGVVVSLAHSAATYNETLNALKYGASNFTHLYNGMSPLNHREPGVVGAALSSDATAELICDGFHVHPAAAKIAISIKGAENIALISDSLAPAGMPDGKYKLGNQDIMVKDGKATIPAGNLAGSTTNILQCFKNVISWGIGIEDAVKMASQTPAKAAGLKNKGRIEKGSDADFTILNKDLTLDKTIVGGKVVF